MIQKFLAKYFFEVIPSIVATVVGAYIITHYINSKTDTGKPPAAISAPVKATDAKTVDDKKPDTARVEPKPEPAKPAVKAASRSSDKTEKHDGKSEDVANTRHRQPAREAAKDEVREKATEAAHEAEGRDANDLARDALARLRGGTGQAKSEQPQQMQQIPATRLDASVPPMGPPVTITPSSRLPSYVSGQGGALDDPSRPIPPADIPLVSRGRTATSVAEDVVSAAKSVFEAVVPR
jgi:hypothetical protein